MNKNKSVVFLDNGMAKRFCERLNPQTKVEEVCRHFDEKCKTYPLCVDLTCGLTLKGFDQCPWTYRQDWITKPVVKKEEKKEVPNAS